MHVHAAVWRAAAEAAGQGTKAALATVARQRGSVPMASDAKLLVTETRRVGTVGGGCVEAEVIAQALATEAPMVARHTLTSDMAGDLGLSCGGTVDLFLEPVVPAAQALYGAVADALDGRTAGTVSTGLDWHDEPRKVARLGAHVISIGEWRPLPHAAGLTPEAFHEAVSRAPRVILFGAGHVSEAIARVASVTDFRVVVVDDRAAFANAERFPEAEIVVDDFRAALARFTYDADDYVIACTRGHAQDALVVEAVAGTDAGYVGMLGSQRKRAVIWKALEGAGIPPASLKRVKVPIGEDIGADTPAEIGVSVMAELIRIRRSVQAEQDRPQRVQ